MHVDHAIKLMCFPVPLQAEQCRELLVEVFQDPLLQRHTFHSHLLASQGRLLAARYLCNRPLQLKPLKEFLTDLLSEKPSVSVKDLPFLSPPHSPSLPPSPSLTPAELVTGAVKTLTNLADHFSTNCRGKKMEEEEDGIVGVLSSDLQSWGVLVDLLGGLLQLGSLLGTQGDTLRALRYAKEGANLARRMGLGTWSVSLFLFIFLYASLCLWLSACVSSVAGCLHGVLFVTFIYPHLDILR